MDKSKKSTSKRKTATKKVTKKAASGKKGKGGKSDKTAKIINCWCRKKLKSSLFFIDSSTVSARNLSIFDNNEK